MKKAQKNLKMKHKTKIGSDGVPYIFTDALGENCRGCAAFPGHKDSTGVCLQLHAEFGCSGGVWQVDVRKIKKSKGGAERAWHFANPLSVAERYAHAEIQREQSPAFNARGPTITTQIIKEPGQ